MQYKQTSHSIWNTSFFDSIFILALSLFFCITRIITIYDNAAGYDFSDSASYFIFTLDEPTRMPLITFLFSSIQYFGAITLIQVIISSLAWILLAISIFIFLPILKNLGFILILLLGVSTAVVELDTLILSESLTLSFLILSLATLFLYFYYNKNLFLLFHLVSLVLFSQIKQSTLIIGSLWIVVFVLLIYANKSSTRITFTVNLLFFLAFIINLLTWSTVSKNTLHDRQLSTTSIIEKSFFSEELRNYWLGQGFPAEAFTVYGGPPFNIPIQAVRSLHSVKLWENNTESNPSFRLFKNRPIYTLVAPLAPNIYITNYGYLNSVLPALASGTDYVQNQEFRDSRYLGQKSDWIKNWNLPKTFFWSDNFLNQKIILIFMFSNLMIFAFTSFSRSQNHNYSNTTLIIISLVFLLAIWVNWLLTAYNYERYLIPYSVGLRVICIVIFCLNLDTLRSLYLNKLRLGASPSAIKPD